jgi:hypothetical protein
MSRHSHRLMLDYRWMATLCQPYLKKVRFSRKPEIYHQQQQQQDTSFPRYGFDQIALCKALFYPTKSVHLPCQPLSSATSASCIFLSPSIGFIIPCIWSIDIDLAEASDSPSAIMRQQPPSSIVRQASKTNILTTIHRSLSAFATGLTVRFARSSSLSSSHQTSPIVCLPPGINHRPWSVLRYSFTHNRPQHQCQHHGFEHEPTSSQSCQYQSVLGWLSSLVSFPCFNLTVLEQRWVPSAVMMNPCFDLTVFGQNDDKHCDPEPWIHNVSFG